MIFHRLLIFLRNSYNLFLEKFSIPRGIRFERERTFLSSLNILIRILIKIKIKETFQQLIEL